MTIAEKAKKISIGISRCDLLKFELETLKEFKCLSFDLADKIRDYYQHEIECIEKNGAANPTIEISREYMNMLKPFVKNRDIIILEAEKGLLPTGLKDAHKD